jgi:hypothetical protein
VNLVVDSAPCAFSEAITTFSRVAPILSALAVTPGGRVTVTFIPPMALPDGKLPWVLNVSTAVVGWAWTPLPTPVHPQMVRAIADKTANPANIRLSIVDTPSLRLIAGNWRSL